MGNGAHRLALTLHNDLSEIPRLGQAVERFGADHALAIETVDDINIALDELVTNVIRYAHTDGVTHHIGVELTLDAGQLTIQVTDDGTPFDPLERAAPDLDVPLEERAVGGLGIHFVRTLMDEVSYRREGPLNIVRMVKRTKPATA